jgi:hypothetical protein
LQQFVGVFEEIFELVTLRTENFCGELRGHFHTSGGSIFRNVANFVDLDCCFPRERRFQLLRKRRWLRIASGKCADKSRELRLPKIRSEVDAGDTRCREQLREAAFCGGSAEWNTIKQNLLARSAEQQTAFAAFI